MENINQNEQNLIDINMTPNSKNNKDFSFFTPKLEISTDLSNMTPIISNKNSDYIKNWEIKLKKRINKNEKIENNNNNLIIEKKKNYIFLVIYL